MAVLDVGSLMSTIQNWRMIFKAFYGLGQGVLCVSLLLEMRLVVKGQGCHFYVTPPQLWNTLPTQLRKALVTTNVSLKTWTPCLGEVGRGGKRLKTDRRTGKWVEMGRAGGSWQY